MSDSLVVEFGVSVLKGISGNKHTAHFVLYGRGKRVHLFHSIIDRLPTDEQRQFIIDEYTTKYIDTLTPASAALHQVRVLWVLCGWVGGAT